MRRALLFIEKEDPMIIRQYPGIYFSVHKNVCCSFSLSQSKAVLMCYDNF